jgi:glycosyltransferase involved in cell wall biosynthesis
MRILHVIDNLNTGGAEHMLLNLATEQCRRQHLVEVLCMFELGDLAGQMQAQGVRVTACHKQSGFDWACVRTMLRIVSQFKPDVVHTHCLMGNYYLAFVRLLLASRSCLIVTRHGLLRGGHVARLGLLFHVSLWFTDWAVGVCDAVSEELFTQHARFTPRIVSIKNGIDVQRFQVRNPQQHLVLTSQLGLPEQARIIGIVARLNPVKNHQLLLEAFAIIKQQLPEAALVVIGEGECRPALEASIQRLKLPDAVFLLGDRSDVHTLLAGCDVFVLSSDNEGYSLALLEAAASGLPLVATDVGGNVDIVNPDLNGLLVPAKDPEALATALTRLLTDVPLAEHMGANARRWVEQHGSVQAMADAYDRLYQGRP